VDFGTVREHDGHVYFWNLVDFLKPDKRGSFSAKIYNQGDCKLFRFKYLNVLFYKGQMGKGNPNGSNNKPVKNWTYPPPNSVDEGVLQDVCHEAWIKSF